MKKNTFSSRKNGFTMIELLVVSTIIIVLTTLGLVSYQGASRNARNGKRASDMESVRSAIMLYRADTGVYPAHGPSANAVDRFNYMLNTLNTDGYYTTDTLSDPGNQAGYTYRYWAAGTGQSFSLCYNEEPSGAQICLQDI